MITQPLFTVCLPTFNYAHLLPEAIDSVLAQSFRDFELLIQDDCSTDDTDTVIKRYSDERISYQKNATNIGIFGNLNNLCARAKGRYIKILCADDVLSKWCLEAVSKVIRKEDYRYKLVSVRETPDRSLIEFEPSFDALETFIINRDTLFSYLTEKDNWGAGLAELCVERDYFQSIGYFGEADKAVDFSRDILVWFEMVLNIDALMVKYPLVYQRPHPGQARYKLGRITQLKEMLGFFYGREAELRVYPGFVTGRQRYIDRYVLSHYWYGMKSVLAGEGWTYLREVQHLLAQSGYRGFPWSLLVSKVQQRLLSGLNST